MSNSFSNQTLAQIDLWANKDTLREDGLPPAEEARRGSRAPAPGEDRREADHADRGAGRVPRRVGGRPVQAGALPLLSATRGRLRPPASASLPATATDHAMALRSDFLRVLPAQDRRAARAARPHRGAAEGAVAGIRVVHVRRRRLDAVATRRKPCERLRQTMASTPRRTCPAWAARREEIRRTARAVPRDGLQAHRRPARRPALGHGAASATSATPPTWSSSSAPSTATSSTSRSAAIRRCHPQADDALADLRHFKAKVDAGADGAITQYFYNADAYFRFVDDVRKLGVDVPIVPGIMPISNFTQLRRFSEACGAEIPRWVGKRMQAYGDDVDSDPRVRRRLGRRPVPAPGRRRRARRCISTR